VEGSPEAAGGKRSAERSRGWSCGSMSGIMVVGWERVPDAVLVVVVLTMSDVFSVAHSHLFTTIPGQLDALPEFISDGSFISSLAK